MEMLLKLCESMAVTETIHMSNLRYSELIQLTTWEDRFEYLKLFGKPFSARPMSLDRYLNSAFYGSQEWKSVRAKVIARDNGCDLGVPGYEIYSKLYVHHLIPVSIEDITQHKQWVFDPEYLITVSYDTHNAIHYGTHAANAATPVERKPGDTTLW